MVATCKAKSKNIDKEELLKVLSKKADTCLIS